MFLHGVRHRCEEVDFLLFLQGPLILTASTPILCGAGSVFLDFPMLVIFPVTSVSLTMSIMHVGLILGIKLQL